MSQKIKTAQVRWVDGLEFEAATGSKHTMTSDAGILAGGQNYGPSPIELLLVGLAGCTGMDALDILKKKRQDLRGLEVRVEGKRAETHPMVYADIDVTYIVRGAAVSPKAVDDAIRLSETKYCGAGIMLGKTAKITSHNEIVLE
jgi:putative redox protein